MKLLYSQSTTSMPQASRQREGKFDLPGNIRNTLGRAARFSSEQWKGAEEYTRYSTRVAKRNKPFIAGILASLGVMAGTVKFTDITKKDMLGPGMTSMSIWIGLRLNRNKAVLDNFEAPKLAQLATQNNLNRVDLISMENISEFCKKEAFTKPRKMSSAKRRVANDLGTLLKAQSVAGENYRILGESKTSNANISTLAVTGVDIPIVYANEETRRDLQALKNSRPSIKSVQALMTEDQLELDTQQTLPHDKKVLLKEVLMDIAHHKKQKNHRTIRRLSKVYERSQPAAYEVYQAKELKNTPDRRLQLEEATGHYTQIVDCNFAGGNLKQGDFKEGLFILDNLELAQMERFKAPNSEWLRTSLVDADMRGLHAPNSRFYGMNFDHADLGYYFEDGLHPEDQRFIASDLTHSRIEPFDYNRRDKIYVKSYTTMNGANLQGAQLQGSDWNGVTALGANFSQPTWPADKITDPELKKLVKPSQFWQQQKNTETNLSHMKLRKCNFTGSDFRNAKMEYMLVPPTYKSLPDVGEHKGRNARTTPLVPIEYIKELRPIEFPNPPVVLNLSDLTRSSWKNTYLNRVDANNNISASFLFKEANLSNADFSKAYVIHPVTCRRMQMPQVVDMAMREEPIPFFTEGYTASQAKQFKQDQTELKDALKNLFEQAGYLINNPPRFIIENKVLNKDFVENILQLKSRNFEDAD